MQSSEIKNGGYYFRHDCLIAFRIKTTKVIKCVNTRTAMCKTYLF